MRNQEAGTHGQGEVCLLATGDCGPVHGPADGFPLERYSELVRPTLDAADLRFGNCERQYSTRGEGGERSYGCLKPEMAQIFSDCRFDVLSLANNHMYDAGPVALMDTRNLLIEKGIQVTGAGADLNEARRPAVIDRNGLRIGFLSYCSAIPAGGEAGSGKPGIAALHVMTSYEPRGPHAPVRVLTRPVETDLQLILDDIAELKRTTDVVVVAFHWGVLWVPRIVSDYQVTVAHACVDAGADLIVGHHAHLPKAIEVYKGRAIFYGLSHLCMTKPTPAAAWSEAPWIHGALRNHQDLDPDYPFLPYGSHAKRSLIAKAVLTRGGVKKVSFLPLAIDRLYRPEVLRRDDPRFQDALDYMNWASDGFEHEFVIEGDEIRVVG